MRYHDLIALETNVNSCTCSNVMFEKKSNTRMDPCDIEKKSTRKNKFSINKKLYPHITYNPPKKFQLLRPLKRETLTDPSRNTFSLKLYNALEISKTNIKKYLKKTIRSPPTQNKTLLKQTQNIP